MHRRNRSLALLAILIAGRLLASPASGQVIIDFEGFTPGTVLFEQVPGLRFPTKPRVVEPSVAASSGTRALSNAQPGKDGEFNTQPLVIEFTEPQRFVAFTAGLEHASNLPIQAMLSAFDAANVLVAQHGPISIGPGPAPISLPMRVETAEPAIVRVELDYSGAFAEVIDDLEFSSTGPPAPEDVEPPVVNILQPLEGARVTGSLALFEARIEEDRQLQSVTLTITNEGGSQSFNMSFSGTGPLFQISPRFTGPIGMGLNTLTLAATDFGGNVGTASRTINRVPIEGQLLVFPELDLDQIDPENQVPMELPRLPGNLIVPVELLETFPGSLDGRGNITVEVVGPVGVNGRDTIRDALNQPEPRLDLAVTANPAALLGDAFVVIRAAEAASGRELSRATLRVSITPNRGLDCRPGDIPLYVAIEIEELTRKINDGIDRDLGEESMVSAGDSDLGLTLRALPANVRFTDPNGNGRFEARFDAIYRDNDGNGAISAGDERLGYTPTLDGSMVAANSFAEIGQPLLAFPADVKFADLNDDGTHSVGIDLPGLDRAGGEPLYLDLDGSNSVSAGDVRLAHPLVGHPGLWKITDMTVQYANDQFGPGLIKVHQRFRARFVVDRLGARFTVDAVIDFTGHLRIQADRSGISFAYTFRRIRAEQLDILDPFGTIAGKFEDRFDEEFAEAFREGLGDGMTGVFQDVIDFLQDAYIKDREFGLGFCLVPLIYENVVEELRGRSMRIVLPERLIAGIIEIDSPDADIPQAAPSDPPAQEATPTPAAVLPVCGFGVAGAAPWLLAGLLLLRFIAGGRRTGGMALAIDGRSRGAVDPRITPADPAAARSDTSPGR